MTKQDNVLLIDLEEAFTKCMSMAAKKNADYAGEETKDVYKNFRNSVAVGVSPERAILVRLMDKITRVSNLLDQENHVKDESIEDTLLDMVNYSAILLSYLKRNKQPQK